MALLGDAESILRVSDSRRYRSELGMVELHRAEARMRTAAAIPVLRQPQLPFVRLFHALGQYNVKALSPAESTDLRHPYAGRDARRLDQKEWRRVRSLVADGLRFLVRVQPILRERRRNVWW